ncbi:MAG TPA: glycosyltransferase family 2 protein [Conexibacter sp.]|jgi:glycosyltransferase involved in cell wall biosynthesis|nr:glycosyltransferase family 2 protein [Conexibacter sp.]
MSETSVVAATPASRPAPLPVGSAAPSRLPGLSIILPCFNEEANVADAIRYAAAVAAEAAADYEVIVVNDGSTDATAERAAAFAATDEHVRLVVHAVNRGYGDALRSGLAAARMPWIFLTDADLQFDLRELERFVPLAGDADLLVGRRAQRRDPLGRRVNARMWNWLVRRLFAIPIRDVDCAFKLVRASALDGVELRSHGAMISTELIVKLLARGARLQERDVQHRPRIAGEQSGANPRVVLRALRELVWLRGELRGRLHPAP